MVAAISTADISVGCIRMAGSVNPRVEFGGLRIAPGVHGGDPRALRSDRHESGGAARVGRRCGPPWAIGARAVIQRGFRQQRGGGEGKAR
jgi:hypothetical protein